MNSERFASIDWPALARANAFSVARVARAAGVSLRQFERDCHAHAGCTPHQFIDACRVREAQVLLRLTSQSVKAIALEVHFKHTPALTRAFKRVTGMTPQRYRQSLETRQLTLNLRLPDTL